MKKLNYWILLLVAAMLMPALTVQAKGKKDKNVVAEQTTGAQDREQWVKWLWKISYPVIHNLAEGTLHQNMPIETVGGGAYIGRCGSLVGFARRRYGGRQAAQADARRSVERVEECCGS